MLSQYVSRNPSMGKVSIPWNTNGIENASGGIDVGTHVIEVVQVPKGCRIVDAIFIVESAATNGSGTTVATVQTDEGSPTVIIGTGTPINLEAVSVTKFDDTTGAANKATGRKKMTANTNLEIVVVVATAAATVGAAGVLLLELAREDYTP